MSVPDGLRLYQAMEGFRFVEDPRMELAKQVRFPRSKKARIRRKWGKRRENNVFGAMTQLLYSAEQKVVVGHPDTLLALKAKIADSRAKHERELGKQNSGVAG